MFWRWSHFNRHDDPMREYFPFYFEEETVNLWIKTVEGNKDLKLRSSAQYIESVQLPIDCTPHAML